MAKILLTALNTTTEIATADVILVQKDSETEAKQITGANLYAGLAKTSDIGTTIQGHSAVLDASTASFLTAQETKLAKIETVQALTPGATVAVDMGTYSNFALGVTENFTLSNPTGHTPGQRGYIEIVQDPTGSRLITLGTNYVTPGGVGITLTTTAGAGDVLRYEVLSATAVLVELIADVK